mmetsp:Transcript_39841/g.95871  ORF Transcript_39841/g.95871 Transcript_39841/m.95871 type:complete len:129 (+) Transcript_39841:143-529(+)
MIFDSIIYSAFLGLVVTVGTSVQSFSILPHPPKATTTTLCAAGGGVDVTTTNFWGRPRSKEEIVDFVSDAVFNNEHEAPTSNAAQLLSNAQERWVEVISAEPPVRRAFYINIFELGNSESSWAQNPFS